MSTTFRLAELADVPSGRYRLDTAAGSSSPAGDLSLTEPLLLVRQGQPPAPVKSSTGLPVLYAKRLGLGDRVLATVMLAADSQAPGAPSGAAGATLQALADLDAAKAPLVSPAFTGTPTAPTAAAGTNTTQVATTAFTRGEVAALVASAPGTLDTLGEIAAVLSSDESAATALATTVASKAPLASPVFTGNPTAPTPTAGDNDTSIATTAFVKTAVGSSIASRAADATALGIFYPEAHGALADGTTDDTAAVNAAIAAATTAGGGSVVFAAKTYRCDGALVIPNDGGATYPRQKSVRLAGTGASAWNGYWDSNPLNGGTILDLRYTGADNLHRGKLSTYGAGTLNVERITFKSGGTDALPFIHTTNTTVFVRENAFVGNLSNTGTACVQDAIVCAGSAAVIGAGIDNAFQGYGSVIEKNYFTHIRRGVWGRSYFNSNVIKENTFSLTCGAADGTSAAIHLDGPSSSPNAGNVVRDNLIEAPGYTYGIRLDYCVSNVIDGNSTWDGPSLTASVYAASTSAGNLLISGNNSTGACPFVIEATVGSNTIINATNQNTYFSFAKAPIRHIGNQAGSRYDAAAPQTWANTATDSTDVTLTRGGAAGNPKMTWTLPSSSTFEFWCSELHMGQATNYLSAGSLGTSDAWLDASGSNTNVNLIQRAKGTGRIIFRSVARIDQAPATTATAGANGALPATVQGYFVIEDNSGVARKVPFYAT